MIITKMHLSRRTVLRGLGATLALPLLDSMVPALMALDKTAAAPVRRFGVFYVPNGMSMPYWFPKAEGPLAELPPTLRSLTELKDRVLLMGGLADESANLVKGGGDHARSAGTFLTGVPFKITSGADVLASVSMDQIAARQMEKETQLASIELGIESNAMLGACDGGASCAYTNTIAWRTETTPLPIENDPRAVFERLFGTSGSTDLSARVARIRRDKSILDFVTGEAASLAHAALLHFGDRLALTTALAGRTRKPGPIAGQVRIGGFGGPLGLAAYIRKHDVDCLIDATHPFAAAISRAARLAAERTAVPRLVLRRPPWARHPLDRWIEVDSIDAAAGLVERVGRRAWLTVGAGAAAAFAAVDGVRFVVRVIDPPRESLPLRCCEVVLGRGPFDVAQERQLLERHAIDVLVCKASGGGATEAKLIAARDLGLPVIMVRRPPPEPGPAVETVEAALDWLDDPAQASRAS